MDDWKSHDLADIGFKEILYEERPVLTPDGKAVEGLHNVWIVINNPQQLNSYTTDMVKAVILGFRAASNDRAAVSVVFTGAGISTESGIPDFRSPGGVWSRYRPIDFPEFLAS